MTARPFVPLSNGAQAVIVFSWGLGRVSCRLWFVRRSGTVNSTTLQELADGLFTTYAEKVMIGLSDGITLSYVQTLDWTHTPAGTTITLFPSVPGSILSPSMSANCAIRMVFLASQPPRNFRNYNFLPGIPEEAVSLNEVDPLYAAFYADAYSYIIDRAPGWGTFPAWQWVCTSQAENNAPRSSQFAREVSFISVASTVRQRRKRLLIT
jgi:hypothetical protein